MGIQWRRLQSSGAGRMEYRPVSSALLPGCCRGPAFLSCSPVPCLRIPDRLFGACNDTKKNCTSRNLFVHAAMCSVCVPGVPSAVPLLVPGRHPHTRLFCPVPRPQDRQTLDEEKSAPLLKRCRLSGCISIKRSGPPAHAVPLTLDQLGGVPKTKEPLFCSRLSFLCRYRYSRQRRRWMPWPR